MAAQCSLALSQCSSAATCDTLAAPVLLFEASMSHFHVLKHMLMLLLTQYASAHDIAVHNTLQGCVLVNVTARRIRAAPGAVIYNVTDDSTSGLTAAAGEVIVGIWEAGQQQQQQTLIRSSATIDGGKAWQASHLHTVLYFKFWSYLCLSMNT
jgi:hypothetical protein